MKEAFVAVLATVIDEQMVIVVLVEEEEEVRLVPRRVMIETDLLTK